MMAEIGRQSVIFQGAHRVSIRLTTFRADKLTYVIDNLAQSSAKHMNAISRDTRACPIRRHRLNILHAD